MKLKKNHFKASKINFRKNRKNGFLFVIYGTFYLKKTEKFTCVSITSIPIICTISIKSSDCYSVSFIVYITALLITTTFPLSVYFCFTTTKPHS